MRNFHGLLQGNHMETTLIPNGSCGVLQHRMDIRTEFRRIYRRFLPLLGPKTVLQEIGQAALRLPVDLGCRQIQRITIKFLHILRLDRPQRVTSLTKYSFILFRQSKTFRLLLL